MDSTRKTLTIDTSPAQADLGEWIFKLLAYRRHPAVVNTRSRATPTISCASFLCRTRTVPENCGKESMPFGAFVQVQRITAVNPVKALVMRGRISQASFSEWLIRQLEDPPAGQSSVSATVCWGRFKIGPIWPVLVPPDVAPPRIGHTTA